MIRYLSYVLRVNNIIYKHDQDNIVNWGKFHMSSEQICICWTHSVYSLHKVWKWLCFCENEATSDYHHGSALKLRHSLLVAAVKHNEGWLVDPSLACGSQSTDRNPNNSG